MLKEFRTFKNKREVSYKQVEIGEKIITFEVAKITDIYLLQYLLKQVYGKSPWSYTVFWIELNKKQNGLYLKALNQGELVGFVGIRIEASDAHITNIAVLPSFQQKGLGKELLKQTELFAIRKDCLTLSLEVKASNRVAISFYEKYGFFTNGIKPNYYKDNQEDALDMLYVIEENE